MFSVSNTEDHYMQGFFSFDKNNKTPSPSYLLILQLYVVNLVTRDIYHSPTHKKSLWFTMLMTSCWLDLVGEKLQIS